jgi:hypothetical protein
MKSPALFLTSFLCAWLATQVCTAQHMSVQVLDARSARPLNNEKVLLRFPERAASSAPNGMDSTSDADGVARFDLPHPNPSTINVFVEDYNLYPCSSFGSIDLKQVLDTGLVLRTRPRDCKFTNAALQVKPAQGQLVIFMRPLTWWDRFLRHVWE